jgi:hypothetical protein
LFPSFADEGDTTFLFRESALVKAFCQTLGADINCTPANTTYDWLGLVSKRTRIQPIVTDQLSLSAKAIIRAV